MKVTVFTAAGQCIEHDADHAIGASGSYPYWVIWAPIDVDGNQKVTFYPREQISKVEMFGPPEGDKPGLNVVPLKKGSD